MVSLKAFIAAIACAGLICSMHVWYVRKSEINSGDKAAAECSGPWQAVVSAHGRREITGDESGRLSVLSHIPGTSIDGVLHIV